MMLRTEKPEWLAIREGRELYRTCVDLVRGSVWEDALFPPAETTEWKDFKRGAEQRAEAFMEICANSPNLTFAEIEALGRSMADHYHEETA